MNKEEHEWIKEDIANIKKVLVTLGKQHNFPKSIQKILDNFELQLSAWEDRFEEVKNKWIKKLEYQLKDIYYIF